MHLRQCPDSVGVHPLVDCPLCEVPRCIYPRSRRWLRRRGTQQSELLAGVQTLRLGDRLNGAAHCCRTRRQRYINGVDTANGSESITLALDISERIEKRAHDRICGE